METGLSYSTALQALHKGEKVARAGWNGKGMWLQLFSASPIVILNGEFDTHFNPKDPKAVSGIDYDTIIDGEKSGQAAINHLGYYHPNGDYYPLQDFILMKTIADTIIVWIPSRTDALANDWEIVNEF